MLLLRRALHIMLTRSQRMTDRRLLAQRVRSLVLVRIHIAGDGEHIAESRAAGIQLHAVPFVLQQKATNPQLLRCGEQRSCFII